MPVTRGHPPAIAEYLLLLRKLSTVSMPTAVKFFRHPGSTHPMAGRISIFGMRRKVVSLFSVITAVKTRSRIPASPISLRLGPLSGAKVFLETICLSTKSTSWAVTYTATTVGRHSEQVHWDDTHPTDTTGRWTTI